MSRVGILLVHGIGSQDHTSLVKHWGLEIERAVAEVMTEKRRTFDPNDLTIREYVWHDQVRAFSGLAVTLWTLLNLPTITALHTAFSYDATVRRRHKMRHPKRSPLLTGISTKDARHVFWARLRNTIGRGLSVPLITVPLLCFLWIVNPFIVFLTGISS